MHYFLIYKPYGMLSQFTAEQQEQRTLADLGYKFPPNVYPVGRLDADSEGLLLLTDDKSFTDRLLNPKNAHPRTYMVQVEGIPDDEALEKLRQGVEIRINQKIHKTRKCQARLLGRPPTLPEREPPIRVRQTVPDRWIELTLTEGKNRQVRRMCAAVGFPVLRLVRIKIHHLDLGGLIPGEVKPIPKPMF